MVMTVYITLDQSTVDRSIVSGKGVRVYVSNVPLLVCTLVSYSYVILHI